MTQGQDGATAHVARLNEALADRYHVTDELGAGGMAIVYRAQDLRHARQVAIKVLRPELTAAIGPDRFMAEIATMARLQHPNILPLFDSGEAQGVLFYVMPYVEGETLHARIERERQLPIDEAVDIARTVAAALDYAHRQGVIHRDVKPENILLCDGVPMVADFGIALALERAGTRLTQTGMRVGTPAYMSPEQSLGEAELDPRTDLYSLACVLYEALAGEPPHTANSVQALIAKRLNETPTPIRVLRPPVPEHVERALCRALSVTPADRFESTVDFAAALHRVAGQPLVLRAEPRSYGVLMHEGDEPRMARARAEARAQVESVIEACGGVLRESPGHAVVALFTESHACLAAARAAREAMARVNAKRPAAERVHYRFGIAEGAVRGEGQDLTGEGIEQASELAWGAPAQGIRVGTAARHDAPQPPDAEVDAPPTRAEPPLPPQLEDLDLPPPERPSIAIMPFACDAESEAIAEGLRIDITNALMKIERILLIAPSCMNHFRGAPGVETARRVGTRHVLEGTVRRAGDRVRATMQLTDTVAGRVVWTDRFDRILDNAFDLEDEVAGRVIRELDVKLSLGDQARVWRKCLAHPKAREHYYRGLNHFFRSTRDGLAAARSEFERVASLVPDSPVGATWTALTLWLQATRGWASDAKGLAIEWAERAVALPDADGQAHTVLGATLLLEQRWDAALHVARDSVRIRPGCNSANGMLANVLLHCGEFSDAILHAKRAIRIGPVYPPWFLEILSAAHREAGELDEAIGVGREILRLAPENVPGRLVLASALVRGDWHAEARHVARAVPQLDPGFRIDPYLENQPFRSRAVRERFASDLRAAGLA